MDGQPGVKPADPIANGHLGGRTLEAAVLANQTYIIPEECKVAAGVLAQLTNLQPSPPYHDPRALIYLFLVTLSYALCICTLAAHPTLGGRLTVINDGVAWDRAAHELGCLIGLCALATALGLSVLSLLPNINTPRQDTVVYCISVNAVAAMFHWAGHTHLDVGYVGASGGPLSLLHILSWLHTTPSMLLIILQLSHLDYGAQYRVVALDLVVMVLSLAVNFCERPAARDALFALAAALLLYILTVVVRTAREAQTTVATIVDPGKVSSLMINTLVTLVLVVWLSGPVVLAHPRMHTRLYQRWPLAAYIADAYGKVIYCAAVMHAVPMTASMTNMISSKIMQATKRQTMISDLKDAAESGDKLTSILSHEFRTPLQGMIGLAQTIKTPEHSPDDATKVQVIQQSCMLVLNLFNDVLGMCNLDYGSLTIAQKPDASPVQCSMYKIAQQVILAQQQLSAADVALDPDVKALPPVFADPARLAQILRNLLSAMTRGTGAGDIVVSAARDPADPAFARITVHNRACVGLVAAKIVKDHWYLPFEGGSETQHVMVTTVAQKLVHEQGGKVYTEVHPDQGLLYGFTLPFHDHSISLMGSSLETSISIGGVCNRVDTLSTVNHQSASPAWIHELDTTAATVCCATQDEHFLRSFCGAAEDAFPVATFYEAQTLVEYLDCTHDRTPVVILDRRLPCGGVCADSIQLLKSIKQTYSHTAVLMLSFREDEQSINRLLNFADDVILQPYTIQYLMMRIRQILEIRATRNAAAVALAAPAHAKAAARGGAAPNPRSKTIVHLEKSLLAANAHELADVSVALLYFHDAVPDDCEAQADNSLFLLRAWYSECSSVSRACGVYMIETLSRTIVVLGIPGASKAEDGVILCCEKLLAWAQNINKVMLLDEDRTTPLLKVSFAVHKGDVRFELDGMCDTGSGSARTVVAGEAMLTLRNMSARLVPGTILPSDAMLPLLSETPDLSAVLCADGMTRFHLATQAPRDVATTPPEGQGTPVKGHLFCMQPCLSTQQMAMLVMIIADPTRMLDQILPAQSDYSNSMDADPTEQDSMMQAVTGQCSVLYKQILLLAELAEEAGVELGDLQCLEN